MIRATSHDKSKRKAALGKFLQCVGWGAIFGSFLLLVIMLIMEVEPEVDWLFLLVIVTGFLAPFLMQYGRRLAAEDAASVLSKDKRPMVLILRAFAVDKKRIFSGAGSELNLEQSLVSILGCIGPVVAVGRPGEALAPSGAARLYIQDENWKNKVRELMDAAKIVVLVLFSENLSLQAHENEGFRWEIQEAMGRLDPRKLLVILPAATRLVHSVASYSFDSRKTQRLNRQKSFEHFARLIRTAIPYQLPVAVEKAQFLYFNANGEPICLRTRARGILGFSLALRPFVRELGLKPPSANPLVLLWRFNVVYRALFVLFIFMITIILLVGLRMNLMN